MATKGQLTGMRGVYLVAAELSRLGLIASPTSRSAIGADILVTDQLCANSFSVQVKTNAKTFSFWLVGSKVKEMVSKRHIYVFVNLRAKKDGEVIEFYVVPSLVVAEKTVNDKAKSTGSDWYSFYLKDALPFKDKWDVFLNI
jgi:hypothetical protein